MALPFIDRFPDLARALKQFLDAQVLVTGQHYARDLEATADRRVRRLTSLSSSLLSLDNLSAGARQQAQQAIENIQADKAQLDQVLAWLDTGADAAVRAGTDQALDRTGPAGAAVPAVAAVLNGGRDAYLALASAQVEAAGQAMQDQIARLDRLDAIVGRMIDALATIYNSELWQQLQYNRRVSTAFLRAAEHTLQALIDHIDSGLGFETRLYDRATQQVEGALTALSNRGANTTPLRQPDGLGSVNPLDGLDRSWRAVEDRVQDRWDQISQTAAAASDDPGLVGENDLLAQLNAVRTASDRLEQDLERATALDLMAHLRLKADAEELLSALQDDHDQVIRRQQTLAVLGAELDRGQLRYLNRLRGDLAALQKRMAALRETMLDTTLRLTLMASVARWQVQLIALRTQMRTLLSETVRADLQADRRRAQMTTAFDTLTERLAEAGLIQTTLDDMLAEGEAVLIEFDRALGGQEQAPDDLIGRLGRWQSSVRRARQAYQRAHAVVSRLPRYQADAVDEMTEYLDTRSPLLDGLRWLVDNGQWGTLGAFNDQLVSLPGLASYTLNHLSVLALPPNTKQWVHRFTAWLTDQHQNVTEQLAIERESTDLLHQTLVAQQADRDQLLAQLDALAPVLHESQALIDQATRLAPPDPATGDQLVTQAVA